MDISIESFISAIIALTLAQEAESTLGELPIVKEEEIKVRYIKIFDGVVYTVVGKFGQLLNYPNVEIMFNEHFLEIDIPDINHISHKVYELYDALSTVDYVKNNSEVEE